MSYADGLLATGERLSYRTKQHPFIFLWGARYTILALIIAVILFWFGGNLDPTGISGGIRTLLGWYREGIDVEQQLPVLSTYLGHACVRDTYWYLSACPELMQEAAQRLDRRWEPKP